MNVKAERKYYQRFLIKKRAVLKLYLYTFLEQKRVYGKQYLRDIATRLKEFGVPVTDAEIYNTLKEMYIDKEVIRHTEKADPGNEDGLKTVICYTLTDKGRKEAQLYKKQVLQDIENSQKILERVLHDNF